LRLASALAVVLVLSSGVVGILAYGGASYALGQAAAATTECVPTADPFVVTGVTWGTTASPLSVGPGDLNVPLSVSLLYTGGCTLTAASFEAEFAPPLSSAEGTNTSNTYEVNVATDAVLTETYHVNIASDAPLGTYVVGLDMGYNTSSFSGIFSEATNATIALRGTVDLDFTTSSATLVPGEVNNLTLSLSNKGTGAASSLSVSISAPSQVSILTQIPLVQTLPPGSTVAQPLQVYVPASLSGSALSLSLSAGYIDAYSLSSVSTQVLGFSVSTVQPMQFSVALTQTNDTSQVGAQSRLVYVLTNTGSNTIDSPSVSFAASSPMVVLGSSSATQGQLAPGQNVTYALDVGSSPSSTPGVYGGTATVTYLDASGVQHTQTFQIGFVLVGSVKFVIQDVTVAQTSTDLTVSGSLLNEGTTTALYAQVTGTVGSAASQNQSSSYIGEIDVNTPTPFTLTLSYPAPANPERGVPIGIAITYQDSFGTNAEYSSSVKTDLQSVTELLFSSSGSTTTSQSSGTDLLTLVSYSVIAIVVVAVVASAVLVRRRRSSSKPGKEDRVI